MTFLQYMIAFLILYLCVYALISRVWKCIEHCATARAYSKFHKNGIQLKMDDVAAGIVNMSNEKKKAEDYVEKGINQK